MVTYGPTVYMYIPRLSLFTIRKKQNIVTSKTRKKTVLDRGRTDRISLTHDLDLDPMTLQSFASYRHGLYSHAKVQGQRSVGSEDRVETNVYGQTEGQTDGGDRITSLANAVGNNTKHSVTRSCHHALSAHSYAMHVTTHRVIMLMCSAED